MVTSDTYVSGKREFELIKQVTQPDGYTLQLYTFAGRFQVRTVDANGNTIWNGDYATYAEADDYFCSELETY